MDSEINLTLRITHERNLPKDAQGIAELAGALLTAVLVDPLDGEPDPRLLATFKVRSAFIVRQEERDAANLRRLPDGTYYDITEGVSDDEVTVALVNVGLRKSGDVPLRLEGLTDGVRIAWRNEVQAWRGGHPESYGQGDEVLTRIPGGPR